MQVKLQSSTGEVIITEELGPKAFKTGSRGYARAFKATVDGHRYQVSVQAVEIGTKPKK